MYKWFIKRKNLSGEIYDLTASSNIGLKGFETGRLKNTQALEHGISESLEKYRLELDIILKDETDDKAEKRKELGFIIDNYISCDKAINDLISLNIQLSNWDTIKNNPPSFNELFKFTMNYLNGGNGSNQFERQPLITIIVGGNPLKIFFAILTYLHSLAQYEDIDLLVNDIIERFYKYIGDSSQKNILKKILKNLKIFLEFNISESEKELLTEREYEIVNELDFNLFMIQSELNKNLSLDLQFSDMDFALVPNENTELDKIYLQKGGVNTKKQKITQESLAEVVSLPPSGRVTRSQLPVNLVQKKRKDLTFQEMQEKEAKEALEKKKLKQNTVKSLNTSAKTAKSSKSAKSAKSAKTAKTGKTGKTGKKEITSYKQTPSSKEKKSHGFLLVRLKSSNQFKEPYDRIPEYIKTTLKEINELVELNPNGEKACNNQNDLKLLGKTLKLLSQPQLFRHSYLNVTGISKDCSTFIKYLEQSKKLIGYLTSMNINIFVDYLSNDSKDNKKRLADFMNFLHKNGEKQNTLIKTLFDGDGSKLRDKGEICRQYLSKEEVIFNFESIESICDTTKPLFKVMSELVLEFSKRKEVKEVMKIITKKLAGNIEEIPNESFKFQPCKYDNIYVTPHLGYQLDEGNQSLRSINYHTSDLPPNSKITSNPTYKPINLESKKIKSEKEKVIEKEIEKQIDNLIAEDYLEKKLISDFSKLKIAKGNKKQETRNKKLKNKRRKSRR